MPERLNASMLSGRYQLLRTVTDNGKLPSQNTMLYTAAYTSGQNMIFVAVRKPQPFY